MKPTFHPASLNSSPLPNPSHRQFDVNDPEPVNRVSTPDKLASLRQKASLLLDVEHNFHGRIETRDGDQFELNSEFSFSVEFKQEMRLLEHQNRHSLQQKALDSFGVDRFDGPAQSNQSGK